MTSAKKGPARQQVNQFHPAALVVFDRKILSMVYGIATNFNQHTDFAMCCEKISNTNGT